MSEKKLEYGNPLTILGVECHLGREGAAFRPDEGEIQKWLRQIQGFLDAGFMHLGQASKLAGALQWATRCTFKRLGRAMLRPIYRCV